MNDGIISCSDMILRTVDMTAFHKTNEISSAWKNVLLKIHNYKDDEENEKYMPIGERLAGNTRIVDYKKGVLLIETDHSGWIQYLKMYQKFIITGLKRAVPELEVKSFAFRMAGTKIKLNEDYDEQYSQAMNELSQELDKQDEQLKKFYEKNDEKVLNKEKTEKKSPASNLPPELRAKFDEILKNAKE